MQNKIACSYYNASAISANGDLYIWGSGLSGLMGSENALTSETPKKFSLEEINPYLKATHVSMGLNHMAIIAKNKLLDHVNPKMFLEASHKGILEKHRELFERKNWDIFSEFDVYKRVYIPQAEFLQFLDLIEAEVGYTHQEQVELSNLVDYFCLDKQGNVNIVQYIYCLGQKAFTTNFILTIGLNENGRLGTAKEGEESDSRGSTNTVGSEILIEEENFQARMIRKKNRIQGLRQVPFSNQVLKVCCGHKFTIALDVLGHVFVWGYGGDGCMGDGTLEDKHAPFHLKPSNFGNLQTQGMIIDIAAGAEHCLVVNHYHEVYSWGKGKQGRLGHNSESSQLTPKMIQYFTENKIRVVQIAAGEQHSAAITDDFKLYTWGCGANYRLGHGTLQTMLKPCLNTYLKDSFATRVSCGATHTLCIASTGHIYAWGSGMNGRLGIDVAGFEDHTIPARVAPLSEDFQNYYFSEVCAGPHQSFGLTDEGQLFVWGSIKFKTLGLINLKKDVYMPTLLKSSFIRFHRTKEQKKGEKVESRNSQIDVKNSYDLKFQKKISPNGNALKIKRIFCGETNTVFLMVNGDIYITGSGEYGQLCIDPEKKGEEFLHEKSALREIFSEGEVLYSNTPIYLSINLEIKFKHIAVGLHHIIAIDIEGKAYAWGKNTEEQLGLGHTLKYVCKATVIEQVSHRKFAMAVASHTYSALLTETGEIWVFGTAESGCLGVNPVKHNYVVGVPTLIHNIPPMKYIAGGPEHMAVISVNGEVYAWGSNNNGRLGIGEQTRKTLLPTLVPFHERKIFTKFQQVSCGMLHTLLLDSEGCIWGAGAKAYAGFPSENTYKTLEEQNVFVKIPGKMKDEKFLQITSGEFHNLALTENFEVYGWGKGDYGKLGQEILIAIDGGADSRIKNILLPRKIKRLENIKYVSSGVNHSACVDEDGEPYFWGAVQMGRLGIQKEDIRLFKKLKKIILESNIPSLPTPQKVQIHFEEELVRKVHIFTNKTVQQLYGGSLQRVTSTTGSSGFEDSILNLDAVRERTSYNNKALNFQRPTSNTIFSQGLGELSVEENRRKTSDCSDRKSRLLAKLSINKEIEARPTGQGLTEKQPLQSVKLNTSGFNAIKNGTELSVEDYAKRMARAQQLMKTGQMKLQREAQDEDLEYCENTLYAKDTELTEGLRDTLQSIIEQAGELKNNFAAQIVQTQSLMQTSLSLLPQGIKTRKETILHIPNFIAQNIQIYEGIISTLFNHPCYLHSMLNNQSLDQQVTLDLIFKIYKSHDQDERVANLILSLALMVLEDEVRIFESPFHPENELKSVYIKLYGFLMAEQICNKKFIKEITEYLLNKIILPLCCKTPNQILTDNSESNDDGGRQGDDEKEFFDLKKYKTRMISGPEEQGEFDKVLGRSFAIIQKLEEYLKDYLCQPNFSAEGKVSREISYLNHKIIDEYRQVAEHKSKTTQSKNIRSNIERVYQIEKEAKLHVIQLFFKQVPDYLMNYESHGIQVPQQFKKFLSVQSLASIADLISAYFAKTKICENNSFHPINEHIQAYSKKREVIASFIHGLTAHDDYDITLENILCTTEDSVRFKERYNTSLLVQDVINIHNSLEIMINKQKILLGGSNDPLGIMFQYLNFGKISHQDFTYQMLHHPLNFKINSKILRKDSFTEQSQIHKCNDCKLIYPEHFLRMEELKMLKQSEWICEACSTQNPFNKRQCFGCERLVKQHLYQQRSILERYFPLVRKDVKVQGYLSFIKLHTMLFEGDDIVEILTDIAQTLVKEENFERSTKYTHILSLANGLTKKILSEDYAIDLTEAVPENQCFRVLSEMLTQEFEIRRKHKKYLERVEHLLRKLKGIVDQTKRTNRELKQKLEMIGAKVIASKGRFNGVQSKTIRTTTMVEINLYQEKLAFTGVKPFGNFTQVDLKKQKILIGFQMHNKTRAKIANNLKFYFFYHEGVGFKVKVVFVADTWKNRLVSCGNWYKNEVALDEFNIPAEHILELRRTADYKAEVTLGCSTFSVEKLAELMDELLIKNYRYKLQS